MGTVAVATATAVDGMGTGSFTGDRDSLPASVLTGKGLDDPCPLEGDRSSTSDIDSTESLHEMVGALKKIARQCRDALSADATAAEENIYMLMLNHLSSEIFLFNREQYKELDSIDFVVKDLIRRSRSYVDDDPRDSIDTGGDMSMISAEEKEIQDDLLSPSEIYEKMDCLGDDLLSPSEIYDKMNCLGDDVRSLVSLMEELRQTISSKKCMSAEFQSFVMEISLDKGDAAKEEMKESSDSKTVAETREKMLRNFLRELSERRFRRSYAPPTEEEIKLYRMIRKQIASIAIFLAAQEDWMLTNGIVYQFEAETVNKCGTDVRGKYTCPFFMNDVEYLAPFGHKIALVFDKLPEFRQLIRESKQRFSDICLRSFAKYIATCLSTSTEDVIGEAHGRKRAQVSQEQEAKKKKKHDLIDVFETEASHRVSLPLAWIEDKQRYGYLVDIVRNLALMKEYTLSHSLSNTEVRLYARILEHVNSSIWLFVKGASAEEKEKHTTYLNMRHQGPKGDESFEEYTTQDPGVMKLGAREYLEAIVQLVYIIESVFPISVPNAEEMRLYVKIQSQMSMDHLEPRCFQGRESERNLAGADLALAKSVLKVTCSREIKIAHDMRKEFEDMLEVIFPKAKAAQGSKAKEWFLEKPEEAKAELMEMIKGGQGEWILDNLLISLYELDILSTHIICCFDQANKRVRDVYEIDEFKPLKVPLIEGWVALRVEEGIRSNSD